MHVALAALTLRGGMQLDAEVNAKLMFFILGPNTDSKNRGVKPRAAPPAAPLSTYAPSHASEQRGVPEAARAGPVATRRVRS